MIAGKGFSSIIILHASSILPWLTRYIYPMMSSPAGHCWLQEETLSIKSGWENFQVPVLFTRLEVVETAHKGT
jgi:hypothetical protein